MAKPPPKDSGTGPPPGPEQKYDPSLGSSVAPGPSVAPGRSGAAEARGNLVPFDADVAAGPDRLGIQDEVDALASLLLARGVRPPLSVGVFGDWGSGKSFFLEKLSERMRLLEAASHGAEESKRRSVYCARVAQVRFNAWHYVDANLWASLVTHIFEQLDAEMSRGEGDEAERRRKRYHDLLQELSSVREQKAEAEAARKAAKEELDAAEGALESVVASIREKRAQREGLRLDDAVALADILGPDAEKDVKKAAEALGLVGPLETLHDLRAHVSRVDDVRGWAQQLWAQLRQPGWRRRSLVYGGVGIVLLAALLIWIQFALGGVQGFFAELGAWFVKVGAVVGGAVAWVRTTAKTWGDRAKNLRVLYEQAEKKVEERRAAEGPTVRAIEHALDVLRQKEAAARDRVREAQQRVTDVEHELREIGRGRRMLRFVHERAASDDYQRYLGLIHVIHEDFQRLSDLMVPDETDGAAATANERAGEEAPVPPIERIVLFIDDLDRCPSEKVVEVLQAVHLLLAFPLFVVVVAVDPGWLRRSLAARYQGLIALPNGAARDATDRPAELPVAPQAYLEKIFQVPVCLSALARDGYLALVDSLTAPRGDGAPTTKSETAPPAIDLDPPQLRLGDEERAFMRTLAPLFRTPRVVKRFVNVYRLIRAKVDDAALEAFLGDDGHPGPYREVMLLLALGTMHPALAPAVFQRLANDGAGPLDVQVFTKGLASDLGDRPGARTLVDSLEDTLRGIAPPVSADRLREHIPAVARYSFQLAILHGSGLVSR